MKRLTLLLPIVVISAAALAFLIAVRYVTVEVPQEPRTISSVNIVDSRESISSTGIDTIAIEDNPDKDMRAVHPLINSVQLDAQRAGDGVVVMNPFDALPMALSTHITNTTAVSASYDYTNQRIVFFVPSYKYVFGDKHGETKRATIATIENITPDAIIEIGDKQTVARNISTVSFTVSELQAASVKALLPVSENLLDPTVASFENGAWTKQVADCNVRAPGIANISMRITPDASSGKSALNLSSANHPACTNKSFPVTLSDNASYYLMVDYKTHSDESAQIYYKATSDKYSSQLTKGFSGTNGNWSTAVIPVEFSSAGKQILDIYLYAPSNGGKYASITYDNIHVRSYIKSQRNVNFREESTSVPIEFNVGVPSGTTMLTWDDPKKDLLEGQNSSFEENMWVDHVADCNVNAAGSPEGLRMERSTDSTHGDYALILSSVNHPACTNKHFNAIVASDMLYSFSFDFKSLEGGSAKYYYKLDGAGGTEYSQTINNTSQKWASSTIDIVPTQDAKGINVYLYAQASGKEVTTIYDNLRLRPVVPKVFSALQFIYTKEARHDLVEPTTTYHIVAPWNWNVTLSSVRDSVLLIMPQKFDSSASAVIGETKLAQSTHFKMNGYSNAWYVDTHEFCEVQRIAGCTQNADGSYDIEMVIEFWPQRWFYLGLLISGTTLVGCLGYLGYAGVRAIRERRRKKSENGNDEQRTGTWIASSQVPRNDEKGETGGQNLDCFVPRNDELRSYEHENETQFHGVGDVLVYIVAGVAKGVRDVWRKKMRMAAAVVFAAAAGIVWGLAAGLLWFLFLASLFYRWDSRIAGVLAILALTACPILLSLELKESAEQMAVYAYLLLVITVALQLAEFWREK